MIIIKLDNEILTICKSFGIKDISKLTRKQIVDKNGHTRIVYVKPGEIKNIRKKNLYLGADLSNEDIIINKVMENIYNNNLELSNITTMIELNKINPKFTKEERSLLSDKILENYANYQQIKNKSKTIEIKIDNSNYPDEIIGIKKGNAMSFIEADNGSCNPNYYKDIFFTMNCQTCVLVFELRLRGYNVEALSANDMSFLLAEHPEICWLQNPKEDIKRKIIASMNPVTKKLEIEKNPKIWYKRLLKITDKNDRLILYVNNTKDLKHEVTLFKDNYNNLVMYDSQNNNIFINEQIEKQFNTYFPDEGIRYLKVNNLNFNLDVLKEIIKEK